MRRQRPNRSFHASGALRSGWRRWLVVVFAVVSLLVPALPPLPGTATAEPRPAAVPDWVMASLCLSYDDAALAAAEQPTKPAPAPNPGHRASDCAFCLGPHLGSAVVPTPPATVPPPVARRAIHLVAWTGAERGDAHRTASRARAPPLAG